MKPVFKILFVFLIFALLTACGSQTPDYVPKPKGYPRLDLPVRQYKPLPGLHPYQFGYNTAARVLPDTFARAEKDWIFLYYPQLKATVQLTYKPVLNDPKRLKAMLEDSYKLAGKHNIKAYSINEQVTRLPSGQWANLITLTGEVPSQFQFITTDTTTHFLRGALYFNTATANDSLAPAIDYVKADMLHLLKTLRWRKQ
jgi:gliding motility-associated lipoprotein GldD